MLEYIKRMLSNYGRNVNFFYFWNMDFSLIISLKCLKSPIQVDKNYIEGSVSQNSDTFLGFCLM